MEEVIVYRTRFVRKREGIAAPDSSDPEVVKRERRTKQEFKRDCDINLIMARYKKTGVLPHSGRSAAARFGDFSQVPTYQEMFHKIAAANELFLHLPAKVRKEFDNDPGQFIAAAGTPEGVKLLRELGLGKELKDLETPPLEESPKKRSANADGQNGSPKSDKSDSKTG